VFSFYFASASSSLINRKDFIYILYVFKKKKKQKRILNEKKKGYKLNK
jgi:hypothetical protein